MKNKLVAGFMAATMMVSVMSTGVFAKELNPDSETNKAGDTQVTATCLLYTSPSPRDGLLSRMPSSA